MSELVSGPPTSLDREVRIINFLRALRLQDNGAGSATVSEIWETMREEHGETVTRPAYYKILDAMAAAGKIEKIESSGPARYAVAESMHATNRVTLDDVYEMLGTFQKTSDVMARAVEAQQYFFRHRDTVLRKAAELLTREPAVGLFERWIDYQVNVVRTGLEVYRHEEKSGGIYQEEKPLADGALDRRLSGQVKALRDLAYRYLSLSRVAIDVPDWDGPHGLKLGGEITYDSVAVREELQRRVIGVGPEGTALGYLGFSKDEVDEARREMLVSGSDGSFHAGSLQIGTAQKYIEDESYTVTFNNSVAYMRSSERLKAVRGRKQIVHSAPFRRDKIDDPTYKGMVLAPFMFPDLTPAQYDHMSRTATDVVQMRVDDELLSGTARDMATGELIRQPRVHFRDGTVTPQSRGYNQYTAPNAYGELVREGIVRSRNILERMTGSEDPPYVYAGAVKTTQIKLFARLLSWYIAIGSKCANGGRPLDSDWEAGHANFVSDVDAMTLLLSALPKPDGEGFWISCVVVRSFASLTEFYDLKLGRMTWFDYLDERRRRQIETYERAPSSVHMSYDASLSERELKNDAYLYMLGHADYASFYVGHTHGDPAPKIPRYEFMCSLRPRGTYVSPEAAREHVQRTAREIALALRVSGFTPDKDHNYLSRLSLVRLVVSVIYTAHEIAKQLGKKLESEFRSSVIAKLARQRRVPEKDVELIPVGIRRYIERLARNQSRLPGPDDENEGEVR